MNTGLKLWVQELVKLVDSKTRTTQGPAQKKLGSYLREGVNEDLCEWGN